MYIIVKEMDVGGTMLKQALIYDNQLVCFNDIEIADLERMYLQPDYKERLLVHKTRH